MIFTYWTGNNDDMTSLSTWRQRFPDFHVFSDKDVISILSIYFPEYVEIYNRIRIPACRSDLARLALLYEHGGLYVDAHAGPSSGDRLAGIFSLLADYDLIIFDQPWKRQDNNDIYIINGVLGARRGCDILLLLLKSGFENISDHWTKEVSSNDHVPYNIYSMTGAWDISVCLFDRSQRPMGLRPEFEDRVHLYMLKQNVEQDGIHLYKFYQYRKPGDHWSERQKTQALFDKSINANDADKTLQAPLKIKELINRAVMAAEKANRSRDYKEAIRLLLPEILIASRNRRLNLQLGRAYAGLGDQENAMKYFLAAADE
jgi:hypothetical protein